MILSILKKHSTSIQLVATRLPLGIGKVGICLKQQMSESQVLVISPCPGGAMTLASRECCCGMGMCKSSYHYEQLFPEAAVIAHIPPEESKANFPGFSPSSLILAAFPISLNIS